MVQQPSYTNFDNKGREGFLSQIGNFTPGERDLFHRLCRAWEPEIGYQRVLAAASSENANARTDLERLMSRLKSEGVGLISTQIKDGQRQPHTLLLCEKLEKRFFEKLVEEYLIDVLEDPAQQLPGIQFLKAQGVQIPEEYLDPIDFEQLASLTGEKDAAGRVEGSLFLLPLGKDESYLITKSGVRRFASSALIKAQFLFQNSNLLAAGAALLNSSLMEMKKNIASRLPQFWIGLTKEVVAKRKQLEAHRKLSIPPGFFPLMLFLQRLIEAQVEAGKKAKQQDEERKLDLQAMAEEIRRAPSLALSDENFGNVLQGYKEKYGEGFENFKSEFEERYLKPAARANLSIILHLEKTYVHSDNLHSLFLSRINSIGPELQKIYLALMMVYIKNGGRMQDPCFTSPASMEDDIAEKIRNEDPLLFQLLQRPQAVAEAIINSSKKSNKVRSAEEMKLVLAGFFYPDQIRFKELAIICGIDLREIYQQAFMRLSILRQIIMRVTGKHESFNRQFNEHVQKLYSNLAKHSESRQDAEPEGRPSRSKAPESSAKAGPGAEKSRRKLGSSPAKPAKTAKMYSETEQEKAWRSFQDSLKK